MEEGHRKDFIEEMNLIQEDGLLELSTEEVKMVFEQMDFTKEESACYLAAIDAYKAHGEHAIDAWDYCRALQLLGWYYVAGFYTEEETLDQSLEVAKKLQTLYTSWDEMCESYLAGYNYWSVDDPNDPSSATATRRAIYEELKSSKENPYTLDWNTPLEKTWG